MTETESLSGFTTQTNRSSPVMAIGLELVCAVPVGFARRVTDTTCNAITPKQRPKLRTRVWDRVQRLLVKFINFPFELLVRILIQPFSRNKSKFKHDLGDKTVTESTP